jgi:glucose-1-phosphate cytidylyltransferase
MKVIILCGGMGTRLREETEYKPKPMVEIGGKPILWHIMKLYAHYDYKEFILALGYKGDVIRNYFLNYHYYNNDFTVNIGDKDGVDVHGKHSEHDWKVTLVETGLNSMTGYRVKLCGKYINEDNFMLTYGDAVSNVNISELVNFHGNHSKIGTVTGVFPPSRFGDLLIKGDIVDKFKEKPKNVSDYNPINGGFFVFKREFLSMIPSDPTCDLEREPLENITNKKQLAVYKHYGFWQCMDTYRDYMLLNKLWVKKPEWKVW